MVSSSYKNTDPLWDLMVTPPNPNHLPEPHLQIPSHWGLGLQHSLNVGGRTHSVHERVLGGLRPAVQGKGVSEIAEWTHPFLPAGSNFSSFRVGLLH